MHFLLSSQSNGSIQVLRVRQRGKHPQVKLKCEFCSGGRGNYVQKILSFTILNKCYFVVTRSAGLVQLYEKQKSAASTISYKLVKEWKNSTVNNRDPVVAVGSFRNQYLYTCSYDGKLVIRDLINDDADDSMKTYLIDGPISCVQIQPLNENMRVLVAAGGQDNEMKMYDLDFGLSMASNLNRLYSVGVSRPNMTTVVRLSNVLPDQRRMTLRRNLFHNFSTYSEWRRLVPVFVASSLETDEIEPAVSGNWISSICFADEGKQIICCGTQFGDLLVYSANDSYEHEEPMKVIHLSSFPINTLHVFNQGRYLLYSDTMSKVGIIDVNSFQVVNFYDYLKIGPTVSSKVYSCPDTVSRLPSESSVSKFKPLYLVAATIDGNIVVYKLQDNNESELRLLVSHSGIVPDLDIIESDAYDVLDRVFGEMHESQNVPAKRRKREAGSSSFLAYGSGHRGHDLRNAKQDANSVEDIKPMGMSN